MSQSTLNPGPLALAAVVPVAAMMVSCSSLTKSDTAPVTTRTIDFTYHVQIEPPPQGTETLKVWIPVPPSNVWQLARMTGTKSDIPYQTRTESRYGNEFLVFTAENGALRSPSKPIAITASFRITRMRQRFRTPQKRDGNEPVKTEDLAKFLEPNVLVPVDGDLADEARRAIGTEMNPIMRGRRLFDHIVDSVSYDKTGVGWGRGDAAYACDSRKGNCTDFHSLFIAEARSQELPARFIMGFPLPPDRDKGDIDGYHCWAEFYGPKIGWVAIDASEANKHKELKDNYFGQLDPHRVQFTIGRDIELPESLLPPQNYVIYPVAEVDGVKYERLSHRFSFRNVKTRYR